MKKRSQLATKLLSSPLSAVDKFINVYISETPLRVEDHYQSAVDETSGGNCLFVGTVRDNNKGEAITHLDFECYVPMALKEMKRIAQEATTKFGLTKISIAHRVGKVEITGIAVIIAVSSKHRKAAFEGCEYLIDELKKHVPIWKKEYLTNGSYWVNSRP